jgi:cytoskeletal protein CcmA (bactofilin family)
MWPTAETKGSGQKTAAAAAPRGPEPVVGASPAIEQATLGATMTVKGELTGAQAFYIDGKVEGSIRFPHHRVTVGRTAVVTASIEAREVVIMGTVTGNVDCGERVDIRSDAVLTGDVVAQRISIDEGAFVKGSVEVCNTQERARAKSEGQGKVVSPAKSEAATAKNEPAKKNEVAAAVEAKKEVKTEPAKIVTPAEIPKAAAAAASEGGLVRVAGSSVLFEEPKSGSRK